MEPIYREPAASVTKDPLTGKVSGEFSNPKKFNSNIDPKAYTVSVQEALQRYQQAAQQAEQEQQQLIYEQLKGARDAFAQAPSAQVDLRPLMAFVDARTGSKLSYTAPDPNKDLREIIAGSQGERQDAMKAMLGVSKAQMDAAGVPVKAALEQAKANMGLDTNLVKMFMNLYEEMNKPRGSGGTPKEDYVGATEKDKLLTGISSLNTIKDLRSQYEKFPDITSYTERAKALLPSAVYRAMGDEDTASKVDYIDNLKIHMEDMYRAAVSVREAGVMTDRDWNYFQNLKPLEIGNYPKVMAWMKTKENEWEEKIKLKTDFLGAKLPVSKAKTLVSENLKASPNIFSAPKPAPKGSSIEGIPSAPTQTMSVAQKLEEIRKRKKK